MPSDFDQYLASLEIVSTPLVLKPKGNLPELSQDFDSTGFSKYHHRYAQYPLGILWKSENAVALVDVSMGDWGPAPSVTTYDLNGNPIDSTLLYDRAGLDAGYASYEYITFLGGGQITVRDTTDTYEVDEEMKRAFEYTLERTTGLVTYSFSESGKITREETREDITPIKDFGFLQNVEWKKPPFTDSTNFDNYSEVYPLSKTQIEFLKLEQLYGPGAIGFLGAITDLQYRVDLDDQFTSIVVVMTPTDNEMGVELINYNRENEIIDRLTLATDDLVEGFIKKISNVDKNRVEVFDYHFGSEVTVDITVYLITEDGHFQKTDSNE
ncbi:MAG: hypothetical protein SchgKO_11130 [Schleiferiaceae bacterium]